MTGAVFFKGAVGLRDGSSIYGVAGPLFSIFSSFVHRKSEKLDFSIRGKDAKNRRYFINILVIP